MILAKPKGEKMNDQQKEEIIKLRRLNYGYKTIANKLGLPADTVKSHCKRHNIMKGIPSSDSACQGHFCLQCGKPILQDPKRKEKKYCSDACRNKWWNSHTDLIKQKSGRTVVCAKCGKEFYVNMQSNRKYCSHACYIDDRFHGASTEKGNRTSKPNSQNKPVKTIPTEKNQESISEIVFVKDNNIASDVGQMKPPYISKEEELDLLDRIKKIKCKCRKCNKEYEYRSGFGMRYCCSQCFVDDHPGAFFDEMKNVKCDWRKIAQEEFHDVLNYAITKNHAQTMVQRGIITLKEYFEFMIEMLKKYCLDEASLFLGVEIAESLKAKSIDQIFSTRRK